MNISSKPFIALATAGLLTLGLSAQAASVSVLLDQTNKPNLLANGPDYIRVTVSDGTEGAIDFTVETLGPLQEVAADSGDFGIQAFSFNFGTSGATLDNIAKPVNWNFGEYLENPFGYFDATIKTNAHNRKDPLMFSIFGVDGDAPLDYIQSLSTGDALRGNQLFMIRAAELDLRGCGYSEEFQESCPEFGPNVVWTGAKIGGSNVVPIPAAAWLFFSALGLLGFRGFRRGHAEN